MEQDGELFYVGGELEGEASDGYIEEVETKAKSSEVLDKLHPETFLDTEGSEHTMYTFKIKNDRSVKVVFYSPGELPFNSDILEGKQAFVLGRDHSEEKNKARTKDQWNQFISNLRQNSLSSEFPEPENDRLREKCIDDGNAVFFVESNPKNISRLYEYLGSVAATELEMARQNEMMDKIVAGKLIDEDGQIRFDRNTDGEALLLLDMMGDGEAEDVLENKRKKLGELQIERDQERMEDMRKRASLSIEQPLKIEDLVLVHLTKYEPEEVDGMYRIKSTYDASGIPRNTIHFTLNHGVVSHGLGNWDSVDIGLITPLGSVLDKCGKPVNLNTVDSFWELSPGERLELPRDTRIVQPDSMNTLGEGELYRVDGKKTIYKKHFSQKDWIAIDYQIERSRSNLNKSIKDGVVDYINSERAKGKVSMSDADFSSLDSALDTDILSGVSATSVGDKINAIFDHAGVADKLTPEIVGAIAKQIESSAAAIVKDKAIRQTIKIMNFETHTGGHHSWADNSRVTERTMKLGLEMGVIVGLHDVHPTGKIYGAFVGDYGLAGLLTDLSKNKISRAKYQRLAYREVAKYAADVSNKTLRMFYDMGAL